MNRLRRVDKALLKAQAAPHMTAAASNNLGRWWDMAERNSKLSRASVPTMTLLISGL